MCGIFGAVIKDSSLFKVDKLNKILISLAIQSQSRGKDSSGLTLFNQKNKSIDVFKGPMPIKSLLKNKEVIKSINTTFDKSKSCNYFFGHSRLVTNGTQLEPENNQPIIKDNIIGVHNGIIVNADSLWEKNKLIERKFEIDTEILFSLIKFEIQNNNLSIGDAIKSFFSKVNGTVATAFLIHDLNKLVLTTNNGSLYKIEIENKFMLFASEYKILKQISKKYNFKKIIKNFNIEQIKSGEGRIYDLNNMHTVDINSSDNNYNIQKNSKYKRTVNKYLIKSKTKQRSVVIDLNFIHLTNEAKNEKKLLDYNLDVIKTIKRCSKCILPKTFPFIFFNKRGVCNYCINYKKHSVKHTESELIDLVEKYRKKNNKPEVLLPFSGGRDSAYALHFVKEVLDLKPITFTYDWGMVTDLARRNIARFCGKLGVENIIVAADIHWKRKNINKNITAWLKNPVLGMIPLFMAGDKYFFYYAHKVKKHLNIDLEIWGVNKLENTDFKTGFSGIKPRFDKKTIYSLSAIDQIKLFSFVGLNFIKSPGYLNQSVFDTLGSIFSRYLTPKKNYFHLFDYVHWDENLINNTIINNYDWEKAVDTTSTWRIGDGTASFYNYVYTSVSGFSENDTFRSNQIREGMISRDEAIKKIIIENKPRYNSIKWYLEIIGLDFNETIKIINKVAKRY